MTWQQVWGSVLWLSECLLLLRPCNDSVVWPVKPSSVLVSAVSVLCVGLSMSNYRDTTSTFSGLCGAPPAHVEGSGGAARWYGPSRVFLSDNGTTYITDTGNNMIRFVDATGALRFISDLCAIFLLCVRGCVTGDWLCRACTNPFCVR